jgi:molecular chaperone DnaK (HSP70)
MKFHFFSRKNNKKHELSTMSAVGIDFGAQWCTMAVARKGGIDIIPNDGSHLQDP